jgi:hypothetical protein
MEQTTHKIVELTKIAKTKAPYPAKDMGLMNMPASRYLLFLFSHNDLLGEPPTLTALTLNCGNSTNLAEFETVDSTGENSIGSGLHPTTFFIDFGLCRC